MKLRLRLNLAIGGAWGRGAWWPATAGLFLFAVGAAVDSGATAQQTAPVRLSIPVLMVSDVHFDPFMGMDSNAVAELAQAQPADWDKIFAKHFVGQANWGTRFDTSYQLWQTSLKTMKTHAAGVRFVTLSGDLLAHDFDTQFSGPCSSGNCGDLASFSEKTIDYVLQELRNTLGAPVYAALGNNDSPCHDYDLTPGSDFLHTVGETITKDVPAKERDQAEIDFSGEGYYSVTLPAPMENTRLLVVDDIFLASSYGPCPSGPQPPAGKPVPLVGGPQIPWLEKQLAAVLADKKDDAKAWVMGHIPSGVDPFDTIHGHLNVCGTTGKPPKMFLPTPDPGSPDELEAALSPFGDVIALAIFAHSHMDELRLLPGAQAGDPPVAMKMVPSISPFNGNNPSITIAMVDPATATLADYRVIAAPDKTGANPEWTQEYDFAEAYRMPAGKPALSADALGQLINRFGAGTDPTQDALYWKYYKTGVQGYLDAGNWHEYVCLMGHFAPTDFTNCTCANQH
jgi:sphingomyelin phosphodiesterase acid-like 3